MTKRQLQGARSRDVILDAAARLMAANGYEGASISGISKESGLPASSIYWHFASKEGVLGAVMERGAARFFADVGARDLPQGSPRDVLRAEFEAAAAAIERNPDFLRLFMLLLLSRGIDETVQRVRRQGRERLHEVIRIAYAGHGREVAGTVADHLADAAVAMFDGAFLAVQNDPSLTYEALLKTMADALAALGDAFVASAATSR